MINKQKRSISSLESKFSNIQVRTITLQKDETLYRKNETSDSFYLILNGLIELVNDRDKSDSISRRIKKDEFFGLEDLIENMTRPHTATALENSELLKIKFDKIPRNQITPNIDQFLKIKNVN